jgi:hypothetical protein
MIAIALDGHDGSGKTSLAKLIAQRNGGIYVRPFGPPVGDSLISAYNAGDESQVVDIGMRAMHAALATPGGKFLVLDRGWLTIQTLLQRDFERVWSVECQTILCHCGLDETIRRLEARDKETEPRTWHDHFISMYLDRARALGVEVVCTEGDIEDVYAKIVSHLPGFSVAR